MITERDKWISAGEAAARLALSKSTVRRLAVSGLLYRRDSGSKRFYLPSVEAYRRGIRNPDYWAKELAAS